MARTVGVMQFGRALASVLLVSSVAVACSSEAAPPESLPVDLEATLPLADEALDDPEVTTVASDLTPSQRSGSTVAEPETPGPCDADDLEFWTAQTRLGDGVADAVVRVRNIGDEWCEPDVGRSPRLDPAIEPDVWLVPDATADIVVGQMPGECAEPTPVRRVQIAIGETSVVVPTAILTCGWWLTAFYPNDDVSEVCTADDLEVAVTADAVVLRNSATTPCSVGGLVAVEGAELSDGADSGLHVDQLFPGDVVALGRTIGECDEPVRRVVVRDELVGELVIENVSCALVFDAGLPRPWFGAADGPLATADDADVPVVDVLDPFRVSE